MEMTSDNGTDCNKSDQIAESKMEDKEDANQAAEVTSDNQSENQADDIRISADGIMRHAT